MIRSLASLFRPRLSMLNGIAAAGGVMLFPGPTDGSLPWLVFAGVTLLAAGGSALNQALEFEADRLMLRTRQRPVARGSMQAAVATLIGSAVVLGGILLLAAAGGVAPALLGAIGILCYLCVYTPLKRRTPYALAAGAICGALPPLIGWCCAGGNIQDYRIMLLAGLLYLWQIPHFWLFQRRHADDYRKAGFPLLQAATADSLFIGLFGLWTVAMVSATMLLPAFGLVSRSIATCFALLILPMTSLALLRSEKIVFFCLNLFPLLVTLMIVAQKSFY
ncbi:MAG: protoheme IX farnesyltransferase [Pseudomonadota bacterium]